MQESVRSQEFQKGEQIVPELVHLKLFSASDIRVPGCVAMSIAFESQARKEPKLPGFRFLSSFANRQIVTIEPQSGNRTDFYFFNRIRDDRLTRKSTENACFSVASRRGPFLRSKILPKSPKVHLHTLIDLIRPQHGPFISHESLRLVHPSFQFVAAIVRSVIFRAKVVVIVAVVFAVGFIVWRVDDVQLRLLFGFLGSLWFG